MPQMPSQGRLVGIVICVLASLAAPATTADGAVAGAVLPRLSELRREVASGPPSGAYVALRRIWAEWDRGDPSEVEETLHEIASDASLVAPTRTYAGLLEAYARRRRGDLDGARQRIAHLGYVGQWMIVGPFDNDGKAGLTEAFDPEKEQELPINLTRDYDGKGHRPVRWRALPPVSPYGWTDFGAFVRPEEQACVYATTFVRDARVHGAGSRLVSVWSGAAGAERLFWNGVEILRDDKYRELDPGRFAATAAARAGWNRLTAKVCGDEHAPMLTVRIAAPTGAPDEHIEVDADPRHSTSQGGAGAALGKGEMPPPPGVKGPVQAFEELTKRDDPAALEAYARYLGATGSDDPSEHRARELARRAAEKTPTVARLLLAGDVAENRNQRATWIEKAEALVAAGHASRRDAIDTLLARGSYARGSVNARDAIPFYQRVLDLDPDNMAATLAIVEMYAEAGLRDTALTFLKKALLRHPRSVGLLRAMVAALRDEDRDAEAEATAERYAALRFDDPAFARARIDLAVARHDAADAGRWIDRLEATNPDSAGALQTAAQAWLRLGQQARAIAAYRAALDMAPDDTDMMRQLATTYALAGQRDEQLQLLKRVLELMPQAKDVREELAHIAPAPPRPDERYAHPTAEFLASAKAPSGGQARRTLVDLQVTTVFPNGLANRFRQVVYQPLTDSAAAESREYDFAYENDSEAVQLRVARVLRKDGSIEEAIESGAGAMADDPAVAMYTSARSYYIRFGRLEPGDVVEIQYRVEDVASRNEFADYFGEVVYMQSSEPVAASEYVLMTPKSRSFYFNAPKVPGLLTDVEERGEQRIYRFRAKDIPPLDPEPLQPPWAEILGHVNISTYKTWDDMGRWYWGLIRDQLVPDDEVRRRAEDLTKGLSTDAAKVRAVYDYVAQKTRYVALEFGIHGYKPYRCAQIFARGFGDCKDKATLIVTMLGSLGIKATPVVVRTANKGDIESAPASLAPFDHMIAYVPSLDLYLDGTAEYSGSQELPAMDRGALALQINEGNAKLVHLPDPPASASVSGHKVDASLAADGSAGIDWRADVTGFEAAEWRVRFHAQSTRSQRAQQMMAALLPGSEVTSVESGNLEDVEQAVKMRVRGRVPQFARTEGDVLTVPLGRREHMVRDLAPLAERKLDVRMYTQWTQVDDWTIHLPAGARLKSVPVASSDAGPFGSYALDVTSDARTVHVKTTVTLSQTRVSAAEYPAFRAWCEKVDRALGLRATVAIK